LPRASRPGLPAPFLLAEGNLGQAQPRKPGPPRGQVDRPAGHRDRPARGPRRHRLPRAPPIRRQLGAGRPRRQPPRRHPPSPARPPRPVARPQLPPPPRAPAPRGDPLGPPIFLPAPPRLPRLEAFAHVVPPVIGLHCRPPEPAARPDELEGRKKPPRVVVLDD